MKLSDGEKLGLFMLAEIYEHLGVKGEIDPAFVKMALTDGQPWAIKERHGGLFWEGGSHETAKTVSRILGMWRAIEEAYDRFDEEQKAELEAKSPHFGKHPRFDGFDGNAGDGFYGAVEFMVNKSDMGWEHFKGRSLNSHGASSTASNLRMLEVWGERVVNLHRGGLQVDDVASMLNAQAHPGG